MTLAPEPPSIVAELQSIAVEEFRLFQTLIYRESGIYLTDEKQVLVATRLGRRLRTLGLSAFGNYYKVVRRDPRERARMLDCITTNETHFFREPRHFEFLEKSVLPNWKTEATAGRRGKRVRAWSAGCASGEEAYSLAMVLLSGLPGWRVEILATDLSTSSLDHARGGLWPAEAATEIPEDYLKRFMLKGRGRQARKMKVGREISASVYFQRLNLHDEHYPLSGSFDLIFCRNVLIYFSSESRKQALGRLLGQLAPKGFIFLGHSESLSGYEGTRSVIPTVYALERAG